jgi:hypothetical protein
VSSGDAARRSVASRVDPSFARPPWLPGPDPAARWRRSDAGLRLAAVTRKRAIRMAIWPRLAEAPIGCFQGVLQRTYRALQVCRVPAPEFCRTVKSVSIMQRCHELATFVRAKEGWIKFLSCLLHEDGSWQARLIAKSKAASLPHDGRAVPLPGRARRSERKPSDTENCPNFRAQVSNARHEE